MVHINTSFNLPVALKPLSCLEKGLYGHLHLHIHFFLDWPIVFRNEHHLHSHHSNLLPQIVDFSLICDCSFLNYLNPQDWWSAVPLFEAISGEPLTLSVTREKKTQWENWPLGQACAQEYPWYFVFRDSKLWDHERFREIVCAGNDR